MLYRKKHNKTSHAEPQPTNNANENMITKEITLPKNENKRINTYYAALEKRAQKLIKTPNHRKGIPIEETNGILPQVIRISHAETFRDEAVVSYIIDYHYSDGKHHKDVRTADIWYVHTGRQLSLRNLIPVRKERRKLLGKQFYLDDAGKVTAFHQKQ